MKTNLSTATLSALLTAYSLLQSAHAGDASWMVRARALGVIPQESSIITPIGGSAEVNDSVVPELDISYFFNKNIAAELVLATTKHDVTAKNTSSGDVDVGSAWLLPPTVTLQYHFTQWENLVKPYLGAGLNYTIFYNADPGDMSTVHYDNKFGYALQAGADIPIGGNWYFNVDVKKLFLSTKADFNNGGVIAKVDLDPWLVGAGIGYRF